MNAFDAKERPGRREILKTLGALPLAAFVPALSEARTHRPFYFACEENNDVFHLAVASGMRCERYAHVKDAVAHAPEGSGVLVLAEGYPHRQTPVDAAVYEQAAKKRLRLYVEFPDSVPGMPLGAPQHVAQGRYHNILERCVVVTDAFAPALKRMRILALHDCIYVPVESHPAELVLARVAGFETAVYGLPKEGVHPILFRHPGRDVLVSTTKLSQFLTGRYAPPEAWPHVWRWILGWLSAGRKLGLPHWTPVVRPAFKRDGHLPAKAEREAFSRGVAWYSNANLFVAPSWKPMVYKYARESSVPHNMDKGWPLGNGSDGLLEGFASNIEWNGNQPVGWNLRNDCIGEVSLSMALSGAIEMKPENKSIARNLNNFIYFNSQLSAAPRNDPKSPSFGLVGWTLPLAPGTYYGDDNARSMLGTMAAAGVLRSNRWDAGVLRCLLANLRTSGTLGFRHNSLTDKELQKLGWRHFYNEKFVNYHPHFEAYLWACFLRAYAKTHYEPFLQRTRTAIQMTMAAYPAQWHWTNGLQQERARMLLPLAWLVHLEDKPQHRNWLKRIAGDLISFQDKSGAIREEVGSEGKGQYGPPKSNDAYGTSEAPLLQQNGDPVADLLYTTNFAFLGLHEAAAATRDPMYLKAENKLAEFLCRIQVRSENHPELAGGWFRAFDYGTWDYWASGSDWGWGPWSIESGWTQSWITAVLGMRQLHASLWELTGRSNLGEDLKQLLPVMFGS
ncbi:MAG: hypothetical protein WB819_04055 [Terriglobia bacterium]